MKKYDVGVYVGKFFPLHNEHLKCVLELLDVCNKVYVIFYNDIEKEQKLCQELNYNIEDRVEDAKEIFKDNKEIYVLNYKVNSSLIFPDDHLKIKEELLKLSGENKFDIQIFGKEEEEIYKNYIYADNYITHLPLNLTDTETFHATLIRNNYMKYRKYLPELIRNRLDKNYANQIIICITGKSGSGKTTLSECLISKYINSIHIDIDKLVHQALKNKIVKNSILDLLGTDILNEKGDIDRKRLGSIVFNNKELKEKVYNQTWLFVDNYIKSKIQDKNNLIIILDWYNITSKEDYWKNENIRIVLNRDYKKRKQSIIKRDEISEEYFELREINSISYEKTKFDICIDMKDDINNNIDKIDNLIKKNNIKELKN